MINVTRGEEPPELRRVRSKRLAEATKRFNLHGPGHHRLTKYLDAEYQVARATLWRRQHKKCAYCERRHQDDGQPTEHFRPKKYALRNWRSEELEQRDDERYWWLTWSWENLLFACGTCNSTTNKGNKFPLARGTEPMPAPTRPAPIPLPDLYFDLGGERPLLLDPGELDIDPLDHLRWLPVDRTLPRSMWQWSLRARSIRGTATKEVFGLERWSDAVNDTYKDVWRQFHAQIDSRAASASLTAIYAAWESLCSELIQTRLDFTAARWSMLDHLRASTRRLRACALPEPPRPWRQG